MKIFLSGATGFVGSYLRSMLLREGHLLTIVTRNPKKYEEEKAENQQFVSWDDNLAAEMEQADAVINLAGASIFGQRWTEEVKRKIYSSRIETTTQLVSAIEQADNRPSVMVSASGADYYGDCGDKVLDETEESGEGFLSKVCVDWEQAAELVTALDVRLAIPRIAVVLEKDGGALEQMLTPFKLCVGGPIGSGGQYFPWIHMYDLCRGIVFAIHNEDFTGAYNLSAPNPVTMRTFANELAAQLNRPSLFKVPGSVLKLVLGEAADPILTSKRLQPKKLQQHGFEFRFPYLQEALADIL
ncbi:TIGR01777 family oxidoreductase [Fodinibius halophilus]|uniref:TIGR01777 family protein n=1 Tax=Fodinibius halophilus TaxID=1736908 RepID=A0A6M1THP0_9BACT|nr:TIGR01777 family oxidoreductase [Fodinibius halophilus]NGP89622.1 TIGR01777 family protein [Fodinibius halophilus]